MNIYNNEFSSCDKINRPGMGEFYQGSSIKLTEPTIKQKQARAYISYKYRINTTGSYLSDVTRKCKNSGDDINCETTVEVPECVIGSFESFNKPINNDNTFKEMNSVEPEYNLYRDEQKYSKKYNLKIGDRVEIYYKPSIVRNLELLGLDYMIHKVKDEGYNNKLGYITHIRKEQIESRRKTFLPVSFKTCKIASITLDDNKTIDILNILLRKVN